MLLFLGLDFLVTWVYDVWFKLARAEYGIVILILIVIGTIGVLEGVALGILLAVVLFVIDYGRIRAVKHTLSGRTYRSAVDRLPAQRQILRAQGEKIYILQLQGFLFFGTANSVLEQVRHRLEDTDPPSPRFVVLDFRQAHNLDASAALSISKLVQLAQRQGFLLLFSHLSDAMRQQLSREVLTDEAQAVWRIFPDLDHAVEWCEEQILRSEPVAAPASSGEGVHFPATLLAEGRSGENTTGLMHYLERLEVEAGHYLIRQGDEARGLYFIDAGQTTAQLEMADGRVVRLRTMQPGTVIGELSLYAGTTASASVVTLAPSTVYFLSRERLAQMETEAPHLAAALHQAIARTVSERLMDATETVRTLLA